jgi:parallel beta-helix repeat protein
VGTCQAGSSTTIQAAVTGVKSGGIVYVCPGSYPEQVTITQPLTLEGLTSLGQDAAVVIPPSGGMVNNGTDINGNPVQAQIIVLGATGVIIKNMTVDGTGNNISGCVASTFEGIYYENSSGTIEYNVVRNQYQTNYAADGGCQNGLAINVESLNFGIPVTINNNSVSAYQKNGITASGTGAGTGAPGPAVTMTSNRIVGLAATAMNWPNPPNQPAAENGIQVGFGATATVSLNTVNNNIWGPDTSADTGDAASGILIYASQGVTVSRNSVNSAQFGIVTVSDPNYGTGDGTDVSTNSVTGTQIFDAIDLCSNNNSAKSNTVYGNAESGIHLDDTCGSTGNSNTVSANVVNEACAGILLGYGTDNTYSPNSYYNVVNTTFAGDTCTSPTYGPAGAAKGSRARPSPFIAKRKQ